MAGAVLATGGCGGDPFLSQQELEKQSFRALTEMAGESPAKVECPERLKAEVGQTTRCVLTAKDGGQIGYTITVKSYDEDSNNAQMDIQVDETPMPPAQGNAGT
ncbi:DUF4333 domain-containing protein [Saccharomonospora azurea]|uniref:DUF4333 domain-containing protein n=1 Tax=Saccharomonospora azurea TaxID=40988 RepID=UPI0020D23D62|nr:DUF4333 domain-containing protein [Saccharomonospora azurea]